MIEQILNLPVIVQGALGSFLFWLSYEVIKRFVNFGIIIISKFNSAWRKEYKLYEILHSLQMVLDTVSLKSVSANLVSMYAGLNRLIIAIIYLALGLISSHFIGHLSVVAYGIAILYLFMALKAVHLVIGDKVTKEEHEARIKEYNKISAEKKND
jgi:hypothetical protein